MRVHVRLELARQDVVDCFLTRDVEASGFSEGLESGASVLASMKAGVQASVHAILPWSTILS